MTRTFAKAPKTHPKDVNVPGVEACACVRMMAATEGNAGPADPYSELAS